MYIKVYTIVFFKKMWFFSENDKNLTIILTFVKKNTKKIRKIQKIYIKERKVNLLRVN